MKLFHSPSEPAVLPLHKLCGELSAFRTRLLHARATLPKPGYHMDLEEEKFAAAANFLQQIPKTIAELAGKIRIYRKAHGGKYFQLALRMLEALHKDPLKLYHLEAVALNKHLDAPNELFEAVIATSKAISPDKDEN